MPRDVKRTVPKAARARRRLARGDSPEEIAAALDMRIDEVKAALRRSDERGRRPGVNTRELKVRMPAELFAAIAARADRDGTTRNDVILQALTRQFSVG